MSTAGLRVRKRKNAVIYILLVFGSLVVLLPFFYLILTSFKSIQESYGSVVSFFPAQNRLVENISFVTGHQDYTFWRFFLNTMLVFILKTAGALFTCSIAGYAFAKFDCLLSRIVFSLLLCVLFVPGELLGIPFYEAMVNLGLRYSSLYVPMWIGAWFGIDVTIIFLFRQFFKSVPDTLIEAARIDGAGEYKTFLKIVLPQAKPVIATVIILYFIGTYNDIYSATLYIPVNEKSRWVMAQSVAIFESMFNTGSGDYMIPYNYVSVATVLSIFPMLLFFFSAQKNFVESLTNSGLKG